MTKNLRFLKAAEREIYEDANGRKDLSTWMARRLAMPDSFYDDGDDWRRDKVMEMVEQITSDPIEQKIARLMLENYTNEEIAEILDITPARVEWFMRKIEGWKGKEGKT